MDFKHSIFKINTIIFNRSYSYISTGSKRPPFFFDFCHGLCTFLVLWALGDPWVRKLERIKIKFGLTAEERNYVLPPSTFEIARENYE